MDCLLTPNKYVEAVGCGPPHKTRPDTRQDSRGRLGRGRNAKTARNSEIFVTYFRTDTARCRVACPRLKIPWHNWRVEHHSLFTPSFIVDSFFGIMSCFFSHLLHHTNNIWFWNSIPLAALTFSVLPSHIRFYTFFFAFFPFCLSFCLSFLLFSF